MSFINSIRFGVMCMAVNTAVYSQTSTTVTVNSPQAGNDHVARDQVRALPGSKFTPGSNMAHLYLDKNIVAPININGNPYAGYSTGDVYTIDKNLPVGVLRGGHSVGNGQLGYSVPIPLAPGTAGMVPSVGISYNGSQAGGLVGIGWGISGISAITRVTDDVYHTTPQPANTALISKASPIRLNSTDRFSLDGNMIWGQAPNYSSTNQVRRLENDNFTEVRSLNNDASFEVKTKEGMVMEYGNTSDSKLLVNHPVSGTQVPLVYYLNKVTDAYGNYYTYSYLNQNGEVAVKEIKYTGNAAAGLTPYNSVKFYYDQREDQGMRYFQGNVLQNKLILREIELFCEGQSYKRIVPTYNLVNGKSYLSAMTEYGADNSHLNPTRFAYDDPKFNVSLPFTTIASNQLPAMADFNVADFDGDGKSDVLAYEYSSIHPSSGVRVYTGWKLFINQNDGSTYSQVASQSGNFMPYSFYGLINTFNPQSHGTINADFNGDGKEDMLLLTNNGNNTIYTPWYCTGTGFTAGTAFSLPAACSLILADIEGNRVPEAIAYDNNTGGQLYIYNFLTNTKQVTSPAPSTTLGTGHAMKLINAISYDGDAAQELIIEILGKNRVIKIGNYNPNVTTAGLFTLDILNEDYLLNAAGSQNHYGDFNGDGLTDQIHQGNGGSNNVFLRLATQKYNSGVQSFFAPSGGSFSYAANPVEDKMYKTLIADMDNDGRSDVIQLYKSNVYNNIQLYVTYGSNLSTKILLGTIPGVQFPDVVDYGYFPNETYPPSGNTQVPEFSLGDFDGDGFTDIMLKTTSHANRTIIYTHPKNTDGRLRKVTDGFGRSVAIEYNTLADDNIYKKGTGAVFPMMDIQNPMAVVSRVIQGDANGNLYNQDYLYEDAKLHVAGKGFLGFGKISVTDDLMQTKTVALFNLDVQYAERLPSITKTYLLSDLINPISASENIYHYIASNGNAPFRLGHYAELEVSKQFDFVTGTDTRTEYLYDAYRNVTFIDTKLNTNYQADQVAYAIDPNLYGRNYPTRVQTAETSQLRQGASSTVNKKTNYFYYSNGLLKTKSSNVGAACTMDMDYVYHSETGLPLSATASSSGNAPRTNSIEYDSKFRFVTKATNALNHYTEAEYDSRWGAPVKSTDITGLITYAQYDAYGDNTQVTTPDNNTVSQITKWYDTNDDISGDPFPAADVLITKEVIAPNSPLNRTLYTARGLEVKTITETGLYKANRITYTGKGQVDAAKAFYYIPNANPSEVLTTSMAYDDLGRTLSSVLTDGNTNLTTQYSYAQSGGNSTFVVTAPDGKTKTTYTDAAGLVFSVEDHDGKALKYEYYSNGQLKETTFEGKVVSSLTYDACGNLYTEDEPNYGLTTFSYDGFGQLKSRLNNNHTYSYNYDIAGRMESFTGPEGTYDYTYVASGNGKGMPEQETAPNGSYKSYFYDNLNRLIKIDQSANGTPYTTEIGYDQYSNPVKYTYPGGFALKMTYNGIGLPQQVRNNATGAVLWQLDDIDQFGNINKFTLGNGVQTVRSYNSFGVLINETAGSLFDHSYDFDITNGNLNYLSDNLKNLREDYTYDGLDRLLSSTVTDLLTSTTVGTPMVLKYEPNGNISEKTDIGKYKYLVGAKPNAVGSVENSSNVISAVKQDITYTAFEKAENIVEGDETAVITYGPDQQRVKTDFFNTATSVSSTRLYLDNYEESSEQGNLTQVHYLNSPVGCIGMYVIENGVGSMYFTYSDHLGTPKTISDDRGNVVAEQSFDAWGQRRNPYTWDYNSVPNPPAWLYRGFTGHEHLPQFSLINMNGRMYDPQNGRMLSVDPVLHDATDGQSYNKYSYARNNPLKYTDPSGYDYMFNLGGSQVTLNIPFTSSSNTQPVDLNMNPQFYDGRVTTEDPGYYSIGKNGFYEASGNYISSDALILDAHRLWSRKGSDMLYLPADGESSQLLSNSPGSEKYSAYAIGGKSDQFYKELADKHQTGSFKFADFLFGDGFTETMRKHAGDDNPYMYSYQEMQDQATEVGWATTYFIPSTAVLKFGRNVTNWAFSRIGTRVIDLTTKEGGSLFWTGLGKIAEGEKLAEAWARENSLITLSMKLKSTRFGRALRSSIEALPNNWQGGAWDKLSQRFAEKASGQIRLLTSHRGPGDFSTWIRIEKKILDSRGMNIITFLIK